LSDIAKLKLFLNGEEVVHFPATVYGKDLLQVEASFPAGKLILTVTAFHDLRHVLFIKLG